MITNETPHAPGALRTLQCCCCGGGAGRWHQHWNRDTGYGVCADCVAWIRERHRTSGGRYGQSDEEIAFCYGREGVNWAPFLPPLQGSGP